MPGASTTLKWAGGTAALGSLIYGTLLLIQFIAQSNLPTVDPRNDAYSKCIGKFLSDMTTYVNCLDRHSGKICALDDNDMTNMEHSHNCLGHITAVPAYTINAQVIATAHDTCYTYLKDYGECLGLAVQIADFEPCFKREVFARIGTIVDDCKNQSGIPLDGEVPGGGATLGNSFGREYQRPQRQIIHQHGRQSTFQYRHQQQKKHKLPLSLYKYS